MASTYLTDIETLKSVLINYQQNGVDYLYDLEPTQNNLFWAGNFDEHNNAESQFTIHTGNDVKSAGVNLGKRPFSNSEFRIQSVDFKLPSLVFEHNKTKPLKMEVLDAVNFSNEISITFIEDVYHSVQKYHLDWLNRWYDRRRDVLRCGVDGKMRGLDVVLFHYVESNASVTSPLDSMPVPEPIMMIRIRGMKVKDVGNLKVDASDTKAGTISVNYSMNISEIYYAKNLMSDSDDIFSKSTGIKNGIWQGTTNEATAVNDEGWRIARAVTQQIAGEGVIS